MTRIHTSHSAKDNNVDFHGAAIIDGQGREIPITEDMVQEACNKLEKTWHFPVTTKRLAV